MLMENEVKNMNDVTDSREKISPQLLLDAAVACGDWMVRNQITNRLDANRGRGFRFFCPENQQYSLTGNWTCGTQCMSLLALYQRTKDERYLTAAELAGRYVMSLQVMDPREERYYGAIREITPQSIEFAPRDSTTAAWALVWLYNITKNPLYLDRAVLFGKWHMNFGMFNGWPLWAFYMDPEIKDMYWAGSFQSGTGLFYYDLFTATKYSGFIERGLQPIAQNYIKNFFEEDGRLIIARDGLTGEVRESPGGNDMHLYNDDFGNAMLLAAADLFEKPVYREFAYRNTKWLAQHQQSDGGFGDEYPSGVPVSLMYFHDIGQHYNDKTLLRARDKSIGKLLSMQVSGHDDQRVEGAFRGCYEGAKDLPSPGDGSLCINMRTTAYALIALLKLESEIENIWLGRFNEPFIDPNNLKQHIPKLIW